MSLFYRVNESTFEVRLPGVVLTVEWVEWPIVLRQSNPRIMLWLLPSVWRRDRSWWPKDPWLRGQFVKSGVAFQRFLQCGPLDIRYDGYPKRMRRAGMKG